MGGFQWSFGEYKRADSELNSSDEDFYDNFDGSNDEEDLNIEYHHGEDIENAGHKKDSDETELVEKRDATDFWEARGKKEHYEFWASRGKKGINSQNLGIGEKNK